MSNWPDFSSRRYQPDKEKCCERCVFGRGEHAEWCGEPRADKACARDEPLEKSKA